MIWSGPSFRAKFKYVLPGLSMDYEQTIEHPQRTFQYLVRPFDENENFKVDNEAYPGPGILINSEFLNGLNAPDESIIKTIELIEKKNGVTGY